MSSQATAAPEPSTEVYRTRGNHGDLHAERDCDRLDGTPDERIQTKRLAVFPGAGESPEFCRGCCPEEWFE